MQLESRTENEFLNKLSKNADRIHHKHSELKIPCEYSE